MAPLLPLFRIRTVVSLTTTFYIVGLLGTSASLRAVLLRLFSPTAHPYRFVSLLAALLLNHKSLPFFWHVRLFGVMLRQLYWQWAKLPVDALFRPVVMTHSYTPLMEVDYNMHKSNSTYFADLDISRTQLVTCLLSKGIRAAGIMGGGDNDARLQPGPDTPPPVKGNFMIALGAVSCHFKKELKPYEPYEIWTRVLSWDKKWLYMVSHFIRAGTVKPDGWQLQPWKAARDRSSRSHRAANGGLSGLSAEREKKWSDAVLATSISKYVVKKGRLTIPPELVLRRSDLLPARPPSDEERGVSVEGLIADTSAWTWANVEAERLRGLEMAENFAKLDGLIEEFPKSKFPYEGDGIEVLGAWTDLRM